MKIAVFYHCLFVSGFPPEPLEKAIHLVYEQMHIFKRSGLEDFADEIHIGINGGEESKAFAQSLLPRKAKLVYHGIESRSENLTIAMIEDWVQTHPGWLVLYWHAKGAFHGEDYTTNWRRCLMAYCVWQWQTCVADLQKRRYPYESVGAHFLRNFGPGQSQNYWGGNFWWARSDFLKTIPSIRTRHVCKCHGVASLEARYEAEVWIGTGPRLPDVLDYANHEIMRCPTI